MALEESKLMVRFALGVIVALVVVCVVVYLIFAPKANSATVLAQRCPLADQAHLDYHPLTPDYIGKLIAQQLRDDGVADSQVPQGYELRHAAFEVAESCL